LVSSELYEEMISPIYHLF